MGKGKIISHRVSKYRETIKRRWHEVNDEKSWVVKSKFIIDPETGKRERVRILNPRRNYLYIDKDDALKNKQRELYFKRNNSTEPFVQILNCFTTEIVSRYSAKQFEALIRLLPLINYTNKSDNYEKVLMFNRKRANETILYEVMKVGNKTGKKYLLDFVKDNILEAVNDQRDKRFTYYKSTGKVFLRGIKSDDSFSKKVVLRRLHKVIMDIDKEVEKHKKKKRSTIKKKDIYPLALLGAAISVVHYKTFMFMKNYTDDSLVKEGEQVSEVMKMKKRIQQFKFIKQYEWWNMYSGQNLKRLNNEKKQELELCFQILKKVNAIGEWRTTKSFLIMNPLLVYISPNEKYDEEWKSVLESLFQISNVLDQEKQSKENMRN
ncbi:MAG: hypothetical protein ACQEWE_11665 [Bacillota bacterium]